MASLTETDKNQFWTAVTDCLVEFHCDSPACAEGRVSRLRDRIERLPDGSGDELIYHEEPFELACDIAKRPLDL